MALMRMLVTRPHPDGQTTAERLRGLGIAAEHAPLLTRRSVPAELPDPNAVCGLVFTSANGVRSLASHGLAERYRHLPVLAVGAHTAREAEDAGFGPARSADGDLIRLARLIVDLGIKGRLFHPTGRHQSGDFAPLLTNSGATVLSVPLYDMQPVAQLPQPVAAGLAGNAFQAVLLYSRRTADVFARLAADIMAPEDRRRLGMLCLSHAVAEPLIAHRFARIGIADRPDEAAMMSLALAFAREQNGA